MRPTRGDKAWIKKNAGKWKPKLPVKITQAGQPCRHCGTPVTRRTHPKEPTYKPGGYYFEWYFRCPGCSAVYLVDEAKVYFDDLKPEVKLDVFSEEEKPEFIDDGIPPWD